MTVNALILAPCVAAGAYLLGSVPFGVIIARSRGVDLRKVGSGNVGATNVARAVGRRWGYLCFLLDAGKGLASAIVAMALTARFVPDVPLAAQGVWLAAGAGAILGHVFSVFLRFKGGKGVATALGFVLGIWPYLTLPGLAAFAIWIAVTLLSRYVSLGSVVAAALFGPLFVAINWWRGLSLAGLWPLGMLVAVMVVLILVRHRTNIVRLMKGQENKIGTRRVAGPEGERAKA